MLARLQGPVTTQRLDKKGFFNIRSDKNFWGVTFVDQELEKDFITETSEQKIRTGALMLGFFHCMILATWCFKFVNDVWVCQTMEPQGFWDTFPPPNFIFILLLVGVFQSPKGKFYFPILILTFMTEIWIRLWLQRTPVVSCDHLARITECHLANPSVPLVIDHLADCSVNSSMALEVWVTLILMSPRFMVLNHLMHFLWLFIAIVAVLLFRFNERVGDKDSVVRSAFEHSAELMAAHDGQRPFYYETTEICLNILLLMIAASIAFTQNGYMAKSQRRKYMDDLKHREGSEKIYRILEVMLPPHVIMPMLTDPMGVVAQLVHRVSILYVSIQDFNRRAETTTPKELLRFLNEYFTAFDSICKSRGVTKIETVSEEYICAVGVTPKDVQEDDSDGHSGLLMRLISVAGEMLNLQSEGVRFKIGINTGPVVACVVGCKLPRFRLFGNTVSMGSRIMSQALPGKIQFGEETNKLLPSGCHAKLREDVVVKGVESVYFMDVVPYSVNSGSTNPDDDGQTSESDSCLTPRSVAFNTSSKFAEPLVPAASVDIELADRGAVQRCAETGEKLGQHSQQRPEDNNFEQTKATLSNRSPQNNVKKHSDEKHARFEQLFERVRGGSRPEGVGALTHLRGVNFSEEEEREFTQWFHDSRFCKKFGIRIERHCLMLSVLTMLLTFLMVFSPDQLDTMEHPVWSACRFLVFICSQIVPFMITTLWRCAGNTKWLLTEPKEVQFRMALSICVICCCMYIALDTFIRTSGPEMLITNFIVPGSSAEEMAAGRKALQETVISLMVRTKTYSGSLWSTIFVLLYSVVSTSHVLPFQHSRAFVVLGVALMLLTKFQFFPTFPVIGKFFFICNCFTVAFMAREIETSSRMRFKSKMVLDRTSEKIQNILNTLMPPLVVEELQELNHQEELPTHHYKSATVVLAKLCGFQKLAFGRSAEEVVRLIGEVFMLWDGLTDKHQVYKVETVGKGYFAGQAGWPLSVKNSPVGVTVFALDMVRAVHEWSREKGVNISCRIGIHTDEWIGGIVGTEMQRYHLFGTGMTLLKRLEATSPLGRVHASQSCREAVAREMRQKGLPQSALLFEPRRDQLLTSKGDVVLIDELGGSSFLVRRTTTLLHNVETRHETDS